MLKSTDVALNEWIKSLPVKGSCPVEDCIDTILANFDDFRIKNKSIWKYTDGHYETFETKATAKNWFVTALVSHIKGKRASVSEIEYVYCALIAQYSHFEEFSEYETALNTNNVIVVFGKTGVKTIPHSKKYFFTYKQPFDFNPKAQCVLFEKVLKEAFDEDETVWALQEYIGYIFMKKSTLNLEKLAFLVGGGANGKSLLLDITSLLIHESNISYVELKNFSKENNLIAMKDKILNIGADGTNKGVATDVLKKIVSGERIEARRLYNDVEIIQNPPKLLLALNQMPDSSSGDFSYGYLRRLLIFSFKKIIPAEKRDKQLLKKLSKELSGILNWTISGYQLLLEQGEFSSSDAMEASVKQYALQLNNIDYFLSEHTIDVSKDKRIPYQKLYVQYQQWCKRSGVRPTSKNRLIDYIRSLNKYEEYKNSSVKGFKFDLYSEEQHSKHRDYSKSTNQEIFYEEEY